jgi:hypothetical protein
MWLVDVSDVEGQSVSMMSVTGKGAARISAISRDAPLVHTISL